ncbi:MAG: hypothetical protein AAB320_04230 [Elusimicrobiota bacterium]
MRNHLFLLAAAMILSNASLQAANVLAPGAQTGAAFGPVSAAWGVSLGNHFQSAAAEPAGSHPLNGTLGGRSFEAPEVRNELSPIVERLEQKGYTPGNFASLDDAGRRALMELVLPQAVLGVKIRAMAVIMESRNETATAEELARSVSAIAQLKDSLSFYLTPKSLATVTAAHAKALERLTSLKAAKTQDRVSRTAEELGRGTRIGEEPTSVEGRQNGTVNGRVANARALVEELHHTNHTDYALKLIDRLVGLAQAQPEQAVQTLVVNGLAAELRTSGSADYGLAVAGGIKRLAASSPFETVQLAGIRGLAADASAADLTDYSLPLLNMAAELAVNSESGKVKGMAVALLLQEIKTSRDPEYSESIQGLVDRIGESAGGLSKVAVPKIERLGPAPEAEPGFFQQLSKGAKAHPWGAFFGLLSIVNAVIVLGHLGFPALAGVAVAAFLLYIGTKGLFRHHPWATFFQLGLIGGLFEAAAKAPSLSPGAWVALAAAAAGTAAIAAWSFREHRPVLGWFLNWAVVLGATALILGAKIIAIS